jgi:gamma-glutamyltranspeptidase / glutathione hydrolase
MIKFKAILSFSSLFALLACTSLPSIYQPSQIHRERVDYIAQGTNGAVATAHPLATQAAIDVLKKGGNAADAAIAASFVISVVRPQSTGIGGGGFIIYHNAKTQTQQAIDCRERAPGAAKRDMYIDKNDVPIRFSYKNSSFSSASRDGHLAVGIPGLVKGLEKFHEQNGSLPFGELLQYAIKAAQKGFKVYQSLEAAINYRLKLLEAFEETKATFIPNGKPLKKGDLLIQKNLAKSLRAIAKKGSRVFYEGWIAKAIVREMQRGKGILNLRDLRNYKVKLRQPIIGEFKGYKIVSMPPPSSGGIHIVQMLNMLKNEDFKKLRPHSAETLHLITEVMRRAFADRAELLGDPDYTKVPQKGLLSDSYALKLRNSIDMQSATPSKSMPKSSASFFESNSTTHISIVDKQGNAFSSTQTINYSFGSGVIAAGTGIILNDEMDDFSIKPGVPNAYGLVGSEANAVAAYKTMLSSMSPTIVFDANNLVKMVVGSPGGPRIITATFQTILNTLAFEMPFDLAVHTKRIHHQWLPDLLRVEPGLLKEDTRQKLRAKGHLIKEIKAIGDVQAIFRTEKGWMAVSDTRSEGKPQAY